MISTWQRLPIRFLPFDYIQKVTISKINIYYRDYKFFLSAKRRPGRTPFLQNHLGHLELVVLFAVFAVRRIRRTVLLAILAVLAGFVLLVLVVLVVAVLIIIL